MEVKVDTTEMTYMEVDALVEELEKIRARKGELSSHLNTFRNLIFKMRNKKSMTLVSKTTGEVLNPDDLALYDETTHSFYHEEVKE